MIYIIRHGQTEVNHRRALQGRSDFPLNDAGIAQAQRAAEGLKGISFAHVFTSPLRRATQTAKIIAPDTPPVVDERLIEMDYGPYEGMDLNNLPSEVLIFFQDFIHNPAPNGMEPLSSVVERAGGLYGIHPKSGWKYIDFNARDCHERDPGSAYARIPWRVLVEIHWELRCVLRIP